MISFGGKQVTEQDVLDAMVRFDRDRRATFTRWRRYAVKHGSQQYPPKELLRMIVGDLGNLSGGDPTNRFFRNLGFDVGEIVHSVAAPDAVTQGPSANAVREPGRERPARGDYATGRPLGAQTQDPPPEGRSAEGPEQVVHGLAPTIEKPCAVAEDALDTARRLEGDLAVAFSRWTRWLDRARMSGLGEPGVYVLAHFMQPPTTVDLQAEQIIYIGETCDQSLRQRLGQFHQCAFGGKGGHSGGMTYWRLPAV